MKKIALLNPVSLTHASSPPLLFLLSRYLPGDARFRGSDSAHEKFPTRLSTIHTGATTTTVPLTSYAWGDNTSGELGNGTTTNSATPTTVSMPAGVTLTMVSGGDRHSVALDTSGHAWAWGLGYYGQLGNGATNDSASPVAVSMPPGVTFKAIAPGGYHNSPLILLATPGHGASMVWVSSATAG